jgi:prepilin-type processing-associated H-X9-DG protein
MKQWMVTMTANDYLKAGRNTSDSQFHCASLEQPSALRTKCSDYIINAVGFFGGAYGWGLAYSGLDKPGCKRTQVPHPSDFIVLCDRWDKTVSQANNEMQFQGWSSMPLFADKDVRQAKYINPYVHNMGGNYLYADGHAAWIYCKDFRWGSCTLRPEEMSETHRTNGVMKQEW